MAKAMPEETRAQGASLTTKRHRCISGYKREGEGAGDRGAIVSFAVSAAAYIEVGGKQLPIQTILHDAFVAAKLQRKVGPAQE